ncbi:hypothetical protein A2U01_0086760, partial [Trifolium medium]|nr:hypothetical protein [Trifolium medium]
METRVSGYRSAVILLKDGLTQIYHT